jgi:hypothetical protein
MNYNTVVSRFIVLLLMCSAAAAQGIVPIVDMRIGGLIGGSKNGKWLEAGVAAESIMTGPMDLFVFGLSGREKEAFPSARRAPVDDVCQDFFRINMQDEKQRLAVGIGVNAKWNPMPRRPVKMSANNAEYKKAVVAQLKKQHVSHPIAKITQAYRIDLDNDGVDEVLIGATNIKNEHGVGWAAGEYSFAMFRKVTKAGVKDFILWGNFFARGEENGGVPNRYEISGIADLNGDGKMEVVLYSEYYEGSGTGAFEIRQGKPVAIPELEAGCGA